MGAVRPRTILRTIRTIGGLVLGLGLAASAPAGDAATTTAGQINGLVTDPEGKPASNVQVSVLPSFSEVEKQTDSEGHFTLPFNPAPFVALGPIPRPFVVARDLTRNLAAAIELEEGAAQASLRLDPAFTLAGRVTDPTGKAITNAQLEVRFHTERLDFSSGFSARVDPQGRFEIKGLLAGWPYTVNAFAKCYGQESRNIEASDTETNRVDLDPIQLPLADQRIAGVVLDDNNKPVAHAGMYSYGGKQPNLFPVTDSKGHFSLSNICAGPIQLSVFGERGRLGNVTAEGGDTNIVIRISASHGVRGADRQGPPRDRGSLRPR